MQASDSRLGTELSKTQVFVIPHFQRPYVWKEEQWQLLWDDIRLAATTVEAEWAGSTNGPQPTYFLGAIVTQERPPRPKRLTASNIIDGQQRLTTLQVLLAAARGVAASGGFDSVAGKLEDLLFNNGRAVDSAFPEDLPKLLPLPQDRDAYEWAVRAPDSGIDRPNTEDDQICKTREWLEDQIADWVNEEEADAELRLDALHFAVDKRIQIVHILLDASEDPQVIFEALNGRGEPLRPADLVKNLLFQTVEQQEDGSAVADQLLLNEWLPFDRKPWRSEVTTGRIRRMFIDVFLSYWLASASGEEVVVDHLFDTFKRWLQKQPRPAADIIRQLRVDGDRYLEIRARTTGTPLGALVDAMEATQTSTPWPLLLHVCTRADVPSDQIDVASNALASFTMRRAVCRATSKDYNKLFMSVLGTCRDAPAERLGDVVRDELAKQTADSRLWPSDSEFRAGLLDSNLFNNVYRSRLRALFAGLENQIRSSRTEDQHAISASTKLQIEHLLPRKWEDNWPVRTDDQLAKLLRQDAVHRLGNLTLLTQKLNGSVSNRPWSKKSSEVRRHALLRLTTSSVFAPPPNVEAEWTDAEWAADWDEERIRARSLWLAELALQAWPRPPGGTEVEWRHKIEPPTLRMSG